jgi:hypothetical protein
MNMVLVSRFGGTSYFFLVMKVSPDAVTTREGKGLKNRHLACGIVTQLSLPLFNFLGWAFLSTESRGLAESDDELGIQEGRSGD